MAFVQNHRVQSTPSPLLDRKSTRLNSSHPSISYAVFCLKKKTAGTVSRARPDLSLRECGRAGVLHRIRRLAPAQPAAACFFFNDTATTEIYTLSLHDALPIWTPSPL